MPYIYLILIYCRVDGVVTTIWSAPLWQIRRLFRLMRGNTSLMTGFWYEGRKCIRKSQLIDLTFKRGSRREGSLYNPWRTNHADHPERHEGESRAYHSVLRERGARRLWTMRIWIWICWNLSVATTLRNSADTNEVAPKVWYRADIVVWNLWCWK